MQQTDVKLKTNIFYIFYRIKRMQQKKICMSPKIGLI